jgi:hypothetical protein
MQHLDALLHGGWAYRALLVPLEAFHENTIRRIPPLETAVN